MKKQFVGLHLDFIGFSASLLCAIHCAALPFLLTLSSLAGLQFLENEWVEYSIILLSLLIASRSLIHGYRKHHKKHIALLIAVGGFAMIFTAQVLDSEWVEVVLMSLGGISIAVAHMVNWKYITQS